MFNSDIFKLNSIEKELPSCGINNNISTAFL